MGAFQFCRAGTFCLKFRYCCRILPSVMQDGEVANTVWLSVLFSKKPCKHHHLCKKGVHFTSSRSLKPWNSLGNNNLISLLWGDVKVAMWLTLHVPMQHGKGKDKKPPCLSLETLPSFPLSFPQCPGPFTSMPKTELISSAIAGAIVAGLTFHTEQEGNTSPSPLPWSNASCTLPFSKDGNSTT